MRCGLQGDAATQTAEVKTRIRRVVPVDLRFIAAVVARNLCATVALLACRHLLHLQSSTKYTPLATFSSSRKHEMKSFSERPPPLTFRFNLCKTLLQRNKKLTTERRKQG